MIVCVPAGRTGSDVMETELREIINRGRSEAASDYIDRLENRPGWSIVSLVDELFPLLLGETNLRYANFHMVKMATFIRRLSIEGILSPETERLTARLLVSELIEREWIEFRAGGAHEGKRGAETSLEGFLEELNGNNVNNAFFHLQLIGRDDRDAVLNTLLRIGASSIPDSLGHTLSCFYPVMEDMADTGHPYRLASLFAYLMYLNRYGAGKEVLETDYGRPEEPLDIDETLRICSSGDGIVNLHHMITLYILLRWEKAPFNAGGYSPFGILLDWIGGKKKDRKDEESVAGLQPPENLPDEYGDFSGIFDLSDTGKTMGCLKGLMRRDPLETADWLFRKYTDHYHPSTWDPHFHTSLYCSLKLYTEVEAAGEEACLMALRQALNYLAGKVGNGR